jgi:hypothetical protein
VIRAGLARAARLFLGVAAASAAVAAVLGLAVGASVVRAVAVGWYGTGAAVLALGFLASSRGPTRATEALSLRARSRRWATRAEQEESLNLGAVLVVLGVCLILLGVIVDPRHRLF